jgi:hypothetical protein
MGSSRALISLAAALLMTAAPAVARAARRTRPLFEPTDVELELPGVAELDMSFGFVKGSEAQRLVIPDFELDLGLIPHVELDLDGAFAYESLPDAPFTFDHTSPDSLWLALKVGSGPLGLQMGPKLPVAPGTHGVGVELVALAAVNVGPMRVALNLGGFLEPQPASGATPRGLESGLDMELAFTAVWSLIGELAAVRFFNGESTQYSATAGVQWSNDHLQLSIVGQAGAGGAADRYGIMFGVSPKVRLW